MDSTVRTLESNVLSVQRTFLVRRRIDDVFSYLSDFTNTEHWDPGTVTTTRTDSGLLGAGSRFHNVSQFRGRRTELDYELTFYDPSRRLLFTGQNKTVTTTDDMTFTEVPGGTSITYRASFDFHGLVKLVEPMLKRGLSTLADETVRQMQTTLDSTDA
jgi:carbon monoxide dehydrogenase subunit G